MLNGLNCQNLIKLLEKNRGCRINADGGFMCRLLTE